MLYIGTLSGTSMDAIDCVLADFQGHTINTLAYQQYPIPENIEQQLKSITPGCSVAEYAELDAIMGNLFAEAVRNFLQENSTSPEKITAIGSHGQTILHQPESVNPVSLQIGDPNIIACCTGIKTVADFRRMDMAAGGQGAPLAPAFHQFVLQDASEDRAIVNIGGMANITFLPAKNSSMHIFGYDTGPGNVLLDGWIRLHQGSRFDKDGCWASSGKKIPELLQNLLDDPYFKLPPPKSTGREYFNPGWLQKYLEQNDNAFENQDIQSTLLELTAITIAEAIKETPASVVLICGGGVHNPVLMKHISLLVPDRKVKSTADLGLNPDAIEALLFAWLAKCKLENTVLDLQHITGSHLKQTLGALY